VSILTEQAHQRVVLLVPVGQLIRVVDQLSKNVIAIEHITIIENHSYASCISYSVRAKV
jgi:hypothetical protein